MLRMSADASVVVFDDGMVWITDQTETIRTEPEQASPYNADGKPGVLWEPRALADFSREKRPQSRVAIGPELKQRYDGS